LAERHAVTHEVSAIFKLRVFETPQARVDILPCALERGREHRRIARGFRCSTGGMGSDYERSVPKKADPPEDGGGTTTSTIVCTNGSGVAATSSASFG
jgi:hypothetical protein